MNRFAHRTNPRSAHELRDEMTQELYALVYAGDIAGARELLDEMAMVFNDARIRAAKEKHL